MQLRPHLRWCSCRRGLRRIREELCGSVLAKPFCRPWTASQRASTRFLYSLHLSRCFKQRMSVWSYQICTNCLPLSSLSFALERYCALQADEYVDERHRHRYEVNPNMVSDLEDRGLRFVGRDESGQRMEIVELKGHPYFVAGQFHPEFKSRPGKPSPPFSRAHLGFVRSALPTLRLLHVVYFVTGFKDKVWITISKDLCMPHRSLGWVPLRVACQAKASASCGTAGERPLSGSLSQPLDVSLWT